VTIRTTMKSHNNAFLRTHPCHKATRDCIILVTVQTSAFDCFLLALLSNQ